MTDLRREAPLYEQRFPLVVGEGAVRDTIVLRILEGTQPSVVVGQSEKVIHFEVTDDRDPYFLFFLDITESDFAQFKREQAISVDFVEFTGMMIQLFELCSLSVGGPIPIKGADPAVAAHFYQNAHSSYSAKLDCSCGMFSISETNRLKTTTHIHLPMRAGDDCAIKMYLASRLALALRTGQRDATSMSGLKRELRELTEALAANSDEMHEMRLKKDLELASVVNTHNAELNELKHAHMDSLTQLQAKLQTEREDSKMALERVRSQLEAKCQELEQAVASLSYDKTSLTHKLDGLTREMQLVETDRRRHIDLAADLQTRVEAADQALHDAQTAAIHSQHEIDAHKQKVAQLQQVVVNFEHVHKIYEENKSINEEKYASFASNVSELGAAIAQLKEDVKERDGKLREMGEENKHYRNRLREKTDVIRTQHGVVEDLQGKLQAAQTESHERALRLQSMGEEVALARDKIRTSEERLQALMDSNQQHELVIRQLMDELHKQQLGERAMATPSGGDPYAFVTPGPIYSPSAQTLGGAVAGTASGYGATYTDPLGHSAHVHSSPDAVFGGSYRVARPAAVDQVVARYGSPATATYVPLGPSGVAGQGAGTDGGSKARGLQQEYADILRSFHSNSVDTSLSSAGPRLGTGAVPGTGTGTSTGAGVEGGDVDLHQLDYYNIAQPAQSPPAKRQSLELRQYF